jgi:alcohol dehydrogenase, propanol-preferring
VKRSVHLLGPGSTAVVIGAGALGQMAIQVLRALCAATTIVAVDTSADKLEVAKQMGADEGLVSGDDAVTRIKDITKGHGAELVLDLVAVNPTLAMAAQVARVMGQLTVVGVGNAALPVSFSSPTLHRVNRPVLVDVSRAFPALATAPRRDELPMWVKSGPRHRQCRPR